MDRLKSVWLVTALLLGACASGPRPPNMVIVFCDDLGYGDVGPFGSSHSTPHLDRMAAEGLKLTSFYVTSGVCTPSRASLMTGCYPKRVELHQSEKERIVLYPGDGRGLNPQETTVAEILKQQGYATGMVGKWHLGDQPEFLPTRHGFDSYFGLPYSNDMDVKTFPEHKFPPLPLLRDENVLETEPDQAFLTKRYTEAALQFIRSHAEQPFFLYLAHTMPHYPIFASPEFQSEAGPFADSVREIDWSMGQIFQTLKELNLDERTLVIFTSDNGAARTLGGGNGALRGYKGSAWEGGMRVPCLVRWPGRIPPGTQSEALVTSMDWLPTLAGLAGASPAALPAVDGKNIWPILSGESQSSPHDRFYYYQVGSLAAVRSGPWKLHLGRFAKGQWEPTVELYDLQADLAESTNVADQHPDIVARLQALAEEARNDLGDDPSDRPGTNVRTAGLVENPVPLTRRESDSP